MKNALQSLYVLALIFVSGIPSVDALAHGVIISRNQMSPPVATVSSIDQVSLYSQIHKNCDPCGTSFVEISETSATTHTAGVSAGANVSASAKTGVLTRVVAEASAEVGAFVSGQYTYSKNKQYTIKSSKTLAKCQRALYEDNITKKVATASSHICNRARLPDGSVHCHPFANVTGDATGYSERETGWVNQDRCTVGGC